MDRNPIGDGIWIREREHVIIEGFVTSCDEKGSETSNVKVAGWEMGKPRGCGLGETGLGSGSEKKGKIVVTE